MTCFIPGLPSGTPFNISLHCWKTPDVSRFTRNHSRRPGLVKFEARVLVDGCIAASSLLDPAGPWPQLISRSFEFTKAGDLEYLRFPPFRSEILQQSFWNPADEIGRIKIVISEGISTESLSIPVERVKNVVAFSFQHAPLDLLESAGIAWPNPKMWRRGPPNPMIPVPSQHHKDGYEAHLHSRRHRVSQARGMLRQSGYVSSCPGGKGVEVSSVLPPTPSTAEIPRHGRVSAGSAGTLGTQKVDSSAWFDFTGGSGTGGYGRVTKTGRDEYDFSSNHRAAGTSKTRRAGASMPGFGFSSLRTPNDVSDAQLVGFPGTNTGDASTSIHDPKVLVNTPTPSGEPCFIDIRDERSRTNTPKSISSTTVQRDQENRGVSNEANEHTTRGVLTNKLLSSNDGNLSRPSASLAHSLLNQPHSAPAPATDVLLSAHEMELREDARVNRGYPNGTTLDANHIQVRETSRPLPHNLGRENPNADANEPHANQRILSGVFSHRSMSPGNSSPNLDRSMSIYAEPVVDFHADNDEDSSIHAINGPERGPEYAHHFAPVDEKAIGDGDGAFVQSAEVSAALDSFTEFGFW
ncbi:hypothetical protein GGS23DRAFT_591221 [Durotheca rogersii]|uniref:uncharacterized protein n=1 Tax=Durotheca rogersii TaxID=419775 RepID=UPI0022209925|nr:uncharacterized protein GGS23DRAFT_591221 [Durotheca rogersii]KAI5853282.1 hypothetical protein GGS23DRAFT_591221 [Durotheca rogersii]